MPRAPKVRLQPVNPDAIAAIAVVGLTVAEVVERTGETAVAVRYWLNRHGYAAGSGAIQKVPRAMKVEAEIAARIAAAPPSAPCFRCGAARGCGHHRPIVTGHTLAGIAPEAM